MNSIFQIINVYCLKHSLGSRAPTISTIHICFYRPPEDLENGYKKAALIVVRCETSSRQAGVFF